MRARVYPDTMNKNDNDDNGNVFPFDRSRVRPAPKDKIEPYSLTEFPDEDLMILVTQGIIAEPIAELFRRHNSALFNFVAWSRRGNSGEAEDVCQTTWLKLIRCASYQPTASFRTFLFQIARNVLIDIYKSAYEQHESFDGSEEDIPADDLTPDEILSLKQNERRLRQAVMKLPVLLREVLEPHVYKELSLKEIATLLKVGYETVKSRLRRAYVLLRRDLEQPE
jgi:RNA polymerase sigma-70 factor (ECF subfamily)